MFLVIGLGVANCVLLVAVLMKAGGSTRDSGGQAVAAVVRDEIRAEAAHLRQEMSAQRQELAAAFAQEQAASHARWRQLASGQQEFSESLDARLRLAEQNNAAALDKIRESVDEKLRETLAASLRDNADRIEALTASNTERQLQIQKLLRDELERLRTSNEAKLDAMRHTVDEKLQGTLEKRLGQSFALVSERLELVQKGLGEMQNLASDVGGLKRVLTNVKSRGTWGEVQLSRQLEDMLTPDQYEQNVVIKPGSGQSVEYAVKLPGRDEDGKAVYLPIDAKFPQEDYERLLEASEGGDPSAVGAAGKALERAVIAQAKIIADKYIDPPRSTDFAILYLPTEGLFAEIARRPGLVSKLQNDHRIMVTGPTTLMSLLNSLQMGFRSVAIEKRSSEVWKVLSAARSEFEKYAKVWEKLEKQLQTAQNTVSEAGRRTRALERNLRNVEATETVASESLTTSELFTPELIGEGIEPQ